MHPYSLLIVALVTIAGCAGSSTKEGYEQMLQSWQGSDINVLIAKWGPPSRTDELPNGSKMYTYNTYKTKSSYSPRGTPSTTTVTSPLERPMRFALAPNACAICVFKTSGSTAKDVIKALFAKVFDQRRKSHPRNRLRATNLLLQLDDAV